MNQDDNAIDLQRRRTLKMAGALTAGGAIAANPAAALSANALSGDELNTPDPTTARTSANLWTSLALRYSISGSQMI